MRQRPAVAALAATLLLSAGVLGPARSAGIGLALGDSITVGAAAQLEAAGYEVDAAEGRSFAQGLAVLRARGSSLPDRIVVNLGTNSGVTSAQCDQLLSIVGSGRAVTLVTVNIPAAPGIAAASNSVLAACASRGGATLVDWAGYAAAHPGVVCADGIHISCGGAGEYARFVVSRAAGPPPLDQPPSGTAALTGPVDGSSGGGAAVDTREASATVARQRAEAAATEAARLERARAAAAAAETARLAAERQRRLDYLHAIQGPGPPGGSGGTASYEFVPVAVRLSLLANS